MHHQNLWLTFDFYQK